MNFLSLLFPLYILFNQISTKIIAIGDLHSDYRRTKQVFRLAGVIDKDNNWAAGENTVVQVGDILDRGIGTKAIFKLIWKLEEQAKKQGGKYIQLLGNHELMNMYEDYTEVKEKERAIFGGVKKRKILFGKKGEYGIYLRKLKVVHQIGTTVFLHGGLTEKWAKRTIKGINNDARKYFQRDNPKQLKTRGLFTSKKGPLWYRGYSVKKGKGNPDCEELKKALKVLKAKVMVVGHSPTKNKDIESRCGGRVIVIDVGISRAWLDGKISALEINRKGYYSISPKGRKFIPTPGRSKP